jgi:alkanesulfonate monooxygenase SsuD/methylene tetrahydromethanopterin reductase-like flavin-dependent oxidoreductase (luciferase family)
VTGNTYRNPTLLAKVITTLDVVSAGRAILGIGAGWFELEHRELGFEFGSFTDRFNRLEESLQILQPMIKGERPTFSGKWYNTESALANPRYRDNVPLMIGGGGEKKTFAIAARCADHLNIIAGLDELPGKVKALAERCDEAGRDRSTLETSAYLTIIINEDITPDQFANAPGFVVAGSPASIADQIQAKVLDVGIDGVILSLAAHGYTPGVITTAAEALRPLLGV